MIELSKGAVDVSNDVLMVSFGLRKPMQIPRDPNVWTKTAKQKAEARIVSHMSAPTGCCISSSPSIPMRGKLIIYTELDSNKVKSHTCGMSSVSSILSKYAGMKIKKYSFNGKTYRATELPQWYW